MGLAPSILALVASLAGLASRPAGPDKAAAWQEAVKTLQAVSALLDQGKAREALPGARKLVDLVRAAKGEKSEQFAFALENLAAVHRTLNEHAQAVPLYVQALAVRKAVQGEDHAEVGTVLRSLGAAYWDMGDYTNASARYGEALACFRKVEKPEGRDTFICLNHLAVLLQELGRLADAEPLCVESVALAARLFGPEDPATATSLNGLGALYYNLGQYAKAEPLYARALEIRRKRLGANHDDVANSLNNLAGLYQKMGQHAKAEPLYLRALDIRRKALGEQSAVTAGCMVNLASLYYDAGEYAKAEPLYVGALAVLRKLGLQAGPEAARCLNNMAALYYDQGKLAEAADLLEQTIGIRQRSLGPGHPAVANSLNNLASVRDMQGQYDKARELYEKSLAIRTAALGPYHPSLVAVLDNLASNRVAASRPADALAPLRKARLLMDKQTEVVLGFTSESDKLAFAHMVQGDLDMRLTLALRHLPGDAEAAAMVAEAVLRSKGLSLEAFIAQQDVAAATDDTELKSATAERGRVLAELAGATFAPAAAANLARRLADLERRRDELEARISRRSAELGLARPVGQADVRSVTAALPPGAVLVEICRPNMFAFNARGAESKWQPARYVALVLGGGSGAGVRLVDLGDAEAMDQAVADFRQCVRATHGAFRGLHLDPIRLDARREARGRLDKAGRRLHDLAFRPIEKHLTGAGHVFISPEGSLSGVPFEAIMDANGQFLVQRFTISYLNTGRELLRSAWRAKAAGAAIFADPDFDAAWPAPGPALAADGGGAPTSRPGAADVRGADLRGLRFEPLPGTAEEATRVAALLGVPAERVYRGRSASKAALGALPAPRVLHIASHGFFLRRQEPQTQPATAAAVPASRPAGTPRGPASQVPLDNPYLRSGLALAGANHWADANAPPGDNGLLTSLEVASLSLHGTELVVLSACETGLGLQQRGEGVFGLRRAFFQAGAQGLIMSLWKVPDKETADLMERFYAAWLGGKGKADALRQAELETIEALRKSSNGTAHPFFWAGFVLVGDWR